MPEAVAYLRAETLVDGVLHTALHWDPERLPLFVQRFYLQAVLPLTDYRAGGGPRLDSDAPVGCWTVFPASIKDRADTAGETAHRQRDRRDGKHQTARFRPIPDALRPEVLAGKRAALVHLGIADSVREIQALAVQLQRSAQRMPYADDAVGALHPSEEPEQSHDVGPEDGKGAAAQGSLEGEAVLLNYGG